MTAMSPGELVREYLRRMAASFGGGPSPLDLMHPDVRVTLPGTSVISCSTTGKDRYLERATAIGPRLDHKVGLTLAVEHIIEEGNTVAVFVKGRAEGTYGLPYNNDYFFLFRTEGNFIIDIFEWCDLSLIQTALFGESILTCGKEA